jgi:hypothetical protein
LLLLFCFFENLLGIHPHALFSLYRGRKWHKG